MEVVSPHFSDLGHGNEVCDNGDDFNQGDPVIVITEKRRRRKKEKNEKKKKKIITLLEGNKKRTQRDVTERTRGKGHFGREESSRILAREWKAASESLERIFCFMEPTTR